MAATGVADRFYNELSNFRTEVSPDKKLSLRVVVPGEVEAEDTELDALSGTVGEWFAGVHEHLDRLQADLARAETEQRKEGRRAFWSGVFQGFVWFVLGSVVALVIGA